MEDNQSQIVRKNESEHQTVSLGFEKKIPAQRSHEFTASNFLVAVISGKNGDVFLYSLPVSLL